MKEEIQVEAARTRSRNTDSGRVRFFDYLKIHPGDIEAIEVSRRGRPPPHFLSSPPTLHFH